MTTPPEDYSPYDVPPDEDHDDPYVSDWLVGLVVGQAIAAVIVGLLLLAMAVLP